MVHCATERSSVHCEERLDRIAFPQEHIRKSQKEHGSMNHRDLLDRLIRIERAIGVETNFTVQMMIIDVESCLLNLEKERVEKLRHSANHIPLDEWDTFELETLEAKVGSKRL
jgi:hypothetical protein